MANLKIFPAANEYARELADTIMSISEVLEGAEVSEQKSLLSEVLGNARKLRAASRSLEKILKDAHETTGDITEHARAFKFKVFPAMEEVRKYGDALEKLVDRDYWPFPTYEDLLFKL